MLKAKITKVNDTKRIKALGFKNKKPYSFYEFDQLLNMLVEDLSEDYFNKNIDREIQLDIVIFDFETGEIRWSYDDIKLNRNLNYIGVNEFENIANAENSLLMKLINKDILQDPELSREEIDEFKKDFEDDYFIDDSNTSKSSYSPQIFSRLFNKSRNNEPNKISEKSESIELQPSTINNTNEDNVIDEEGSIADEITDEEIGIDNVLEEHTISSDDDLTIKKENQGDNDVLASQSVSNKGLENSKMPLYAVNSYKIPFLQYENTEIQNKTSSNALTQLKYDFLFDRYLQKEAIKKTEINEINNRIQSKYDKLHLSLENELKEYQMEIENNQQDQLNELEHQKTIENEKKLFELRKEEENENSKCLEKFRLEIERQFDEKSYELEESKEQKISDYKKELNQNLVSYLSEILEQNKLDLRVQIIRKKDELLNCMDTELKDYLSEQKYYLNGVIKNFESNTYKLLNSKIEQFKQELIEKKKLENEKLKYEQETLKQKALIKKAEMKAQEVKQQELEVKKNQQKNEEINAQNLKSQLEIKKEKSLLKMQQCEEEKRKNDLKEKELSIRELEIKNEDNQNKGLQNVTSEMKKKVMYKSILIVLSVLIVLSMVVTSVVYYINNYHQQQVNDEKPSYENLISEHKYKEAFKLYPNRDKELIERMYQSKDIYAINERISTENTPQLRLYKAILENNNTELISLYKNNKDTLKIENNELEKIALAFLEVEDIETAEGINKELKSQKISKKIDDIKLLNTLYQRQLNIKE
ncbi:hypothetical protein NGC89_02535 [Staphylococcus xylosus]|uniref:hypothetical protein n=1 Tax=Staphylococcus xylosus TaxID=1288 RepID=UPI002DBD4692|nr:hypothetical protein [Staphylococcus xylosus]MEB7800343.1 hypothetical protein [Staphylococcus xylosus]